MCGSSKPKEKKKTEAPIAPVVKYDTDGYQVAPPPPPPSPEVRIESAANSLAIRRRQGYQSLRIERSSGVQV